MRLRCPRRTTRSSSSTVLRAILSKDRLASFHGAQCHKDNNEGVQTFSPSSYHPKIVQVSSNTQFCRDPGVFSSLCSSYAGLSRWNCLAPSGWPHPPAHCETWVTIALLFRNCLFVFDNMSLCSKRLDQPRLESDLLHAVSASAMKNLITELACCRCQVPAFYKRTSMTLENPYVQIRSPVSDMFLFNMSYSWTEGNKTELSRRILCQSGQSFIVQGFPTELSVLRWQGQKLWFQSTSRAWCWSSATWQHRFKKRKDECPLHGNPVPSSRIATIRSLKSANLALAKRQEWTRTSLNSSSNSDRLSLAGMDCCYQRISSNNEIDSVFNHTMDTAYQVS